MLSLRKKKLQPYLTTELEHYYKNETLMIWNLFFMMMDNVSL